jgi:hypothetical protein
VRKTGGTGKTLFRMKTKRKKKVEINKKERWISYNLIRLSCGLIIKENVGRKRGNNKGYNIVNKKLIKKHKKQIAYIRCEDKS